MFGNSITWLFSSANGESLVKQKNRKKEKEKKYTNHGDQDKLFQTFYDVTNNNEETLQKHQFANDDGELLNGV